MGSKMKITDNRDIETFAKGFGFRTKCKKSDFIQILDIFTQVVYRNT